MSPPLLERYCRHSVLRLSVCARVCWHDVS